VIAMISNDPKQLKFSSPFRLRSLDLRGATKDALVATHLKRATSPVDFIQNPS
jgi:hypothetical protein